MWRPRLPPCARSARSNRCFRDPGRAGRRLSAPRSDGPQVRFRRRRPDQPGVHRAGRRVPGPRSRGARPDQRFGRHGSGSPTSSMPGTATCNRWCCSTTGRVSRRRPRSCPAAILDLCIEHGGSITGEHGVGVDKSRYMPRMFGADDLDTMQLLRCAFDPAACATRARSSRPRGCAARCPASAAPRTRWWPPARWSSSEHREHGAAQRTASHDGADGTLPAHLGSACAELSAAWAADAVGGGQPAGRRARLLLLRPLRCSRPPPTWA